MTPKPYRDGLTKPQKRERRRRQRAAVRARKRWLPTWGIDAPPGAYVRVVSVEEYEWLTKAGG